MLALVLTALGVIAAIAVPLGIVYFQSRKPPKVTSRPVKSVNSWRSETFDRCLEYLNEHLELVDSAPDESSGSKASKSVLCDWSIDLLLAAAASISPYCQGKANMFVVARNEDDVAYLRSEYFVGPFPHRQLLKPDGTYRDMAVPYAPGASKDDLAVAAKSLLFDRTTLESVEDAKFISDPEKELGTTHIVGIPLCGVSLAQSGVDAGRALKEGQQVVIAVDFRFPRLLGFIRWGPWPWHMAAINSRANRLREAALTVLRRIEPAEESPSANGEPDES